MILDGIEIKVNKKQIKNIYIRIKPPAGDVVISAPLHMRDEDIYSFALSKLEWIRACRQKYEGFKEPQLLTGEPVCLWGRPYTIVLREGRSRTEISGENIFVYGLRDAGLEERQRAVNEFYRLQLMQKISELAPLWEQRTGLAAAQWSIRSMKTRWGSCSPATGRISLALGLARKPVCCLEYVIVHELAHLLVPNHGADFKKLMDRFYPDWKQVKKVLNGGCDV